MNQSTITTLRANCDEFPIMCAKSLPTHEEIDDASKALGTPFAADYQEFLRLFGGGYAGPFPVFGLRPVEVLGCAWSVVDATLTFRETSAPECADWIIVSEDQAGNPFGMDLAGAVWIYDHDFGGAERLHPTFEAFVVYGLEL